MILDMFRHLTTRLPSSPAAAAAWEQPPSLAFAQAGADVIATNIIRQRCREQIRAAAAAPTPRAADLAHPEVTAQLARSGRRSFRELDIVVNNIGGTMPNTLLSTSTKDLADLRAQRAPPRAPFVAAVPLMLEHSGGGSVINISSTMGRLAARVSAGCQTHYFTRLLGAGPVPTRPGSMRSRAGFHPTPALEVVAANDELRAPMEQATPLHGAQ